MAVDFSTFKIKFPELVSTADANQTAIEASIAESILILGTPSCSLSDSLLLTWAAHDIALSGNNPNGAEQGKGVLTSESAGSASNSYQVYESKGILGDYYRSTKYGRKFLVIQKYCFGAGIMVAP